MAPTSSTLLAFTQDIPALSHESDSDFRHLAEAMPQFVWVTRPDGNVTYFNSRWHLYTGLSEAESYGAGWLKAFHPEEHAAITERWEASVATGEPYEIEYRIRGADSQYRWFIGRALPVRDKAGVITKWFGTCTEMHEKILAEHAAREQAEFVRNILDSSTDCIQVLDRERRVVSLNDSGMKLMEIDHFDTCKDMDWSGFWHGDYQTIAKTAFSEALQGHTSRFEGMCPTAKGREKWWEVIITPLKNTDGQVNQLLSVARDITERRQRDVQFRQLADAVPQIVWIARPDGYHEYYNKRWYDYTGRTPDESIGESWGPVVHPADEVMCWDRWCDRLKSGDPYEIEYRLRGADGSYRWFLGRGVPVRDASGTIVKWFGTCTDIHDKILAEHQQKQAMEQAEAAILAKTEFLANMSHEIRTPMNAVVGLANILSMSEPLTEKQREFISTLQVSAEQLLQLINDLLDMSKLESNGMHLEAIPFDLNKLVRDVVSINAVSAREKNITLERHGECRHQLVGDPLRIKQIIMNLVGNAVKFTSEGGVNVTVFASPRTTGSLVDVVIAIDDTGIGIAPEKVDSIFGKFTQADSSTARHYGGSGLGLSISKTLTELMGGKITVTSRSEKGSRFTLTLTLPSTEKLEPATPAITKAKPPSDHPTPVKVLLVEDYQANILVATLLLQSFGFDYEIARSGEEALAKLEEKSFSVVLMDVQMPNMNGYQATAIIRERESVRGSKRLPIVGMTAHALKGDRERCIDAGMDDYLSKPFQPDALQAIIEKYSRAMVAA